MKSKILFPVITTFLITGCSQTPLQVKEGMSTTPLKMPMASVLKHKENGRNVASSSEDKKQKIQQLKKDFSVEQKISDDRNSIPAAFNLIDFQSGTKNISERYVDSFFATTALIESEIKRVTGKTVNLSEEYLIRYEKGIRNINPTSQNSTPIENLKSIQQGGVVSELKLPYTPSGCYNPEEENKQECFFLAAPEESMIENAIKMDKLEIFSIDKKNDELVEELKRVISSGTPVVISIPTRINSMDYYDFTDEVVNIYDDFFNYCYLSISDICTFTKTIILVGYNAEKKSFLYKSTSGDQLSQGPFRTIKFDQIKRNGHNAVYAKLNSDFILPEGENFSDSGDISNLSIEQKVIDGYLTVDVNGELNNSASHYMLTRIGYSFYSDKLAYAKAYSIYQKGEIDNSFWQFIPSQDKTLHLNLRVDNQTVDGGTKWQDILEKINPKNIYLDLVLFTDNGVRNIREGDIPISIE